MPQTESRRPSRLMGERGRAGLSVGIERAIDPNGATARARPTIAVRVGLQARWMTDGGGARYPLVQAKIEAKGMTLRGRRRPNEKVCQLDRGARLHFPFGPADHVLADCRQPDWSRARAEDDHAGRRARVSGRAKGFARQKRQKRHRRPEPTRSGLRRRHLESENDTAGQSARRRRRQ